MKKGVVLINLGTPASTKPADVRVFLRRFLSDQRVIKMPRFAWNIILHTMILPFRPQKSAKLYERIWSAQYGSPLDHFTKRQVQQLQAILNHCKVYYAYSYSHPTVQETLLKIESDSIDNLTVIPMYPQYSTTTVGSVADDVHRFYLRRTFVPTIHFVNSFYSRNDYVQALTDKINDQLTTANYDCLLMSYHGIPQSYADSGDPYPRQCAQTTQAVKAKLAKPVQVIQAFQSKFGPGQWLQPATIDVVKQLPQKGIKKVLVVAPAFVADCLETISELNIDNKQAFLNNGGQKFKLVDCLNDSPEFTKVLANIVSEQA